MPDIRSLLLVMVRGFLTHDCPWFDSIDNVPFLIVPVVFKSNFGAKRNLSDQVIDFK